MTADTDYSREVANTIRQQITAGALMRVGAHDLKFVTEPNPGLTFKARIAPKGYSAVRIMRVTVTLTPADLYDIQVVWQRERFADPETHFEADGIYCDQLAEMIIGLDKDGRE